MRLKCSLASLHQWKKNNSFKAYRNTCQFTMPVYHFWNVFDWYSQNVWNNTYGPTIHLFPIRLLRKNFWCYKMKKEGNLIIMLTDFSAMMCYVLRGDIFTSTLDVSSLNFCDMVFFFNYVYLCHLMTFVSSFANPEGFYYDPTYM